MSSCCPISMCEAPDCLQLTERETEVCAAICTASAPVTFSSLKGSLGYHQEVLSRILRRLVNYRAIEKVRGRYRRVGQ